MITVDNVLFVSDPEDYANFARDKSFIEALQTASGKISKKEAKIKDSVVFTEKILSDS